MREEIINEKNGKVMLVLPAHSRMFSSVFSRTVCVALGVRSLSAAVVERHVGADNAGTARSNVVKRTMCFVGRIIFRLN